MNLILAVGNPQGADMPLNKPNQIYFCFESLGKIIDK